MIEKKLQSLKINKLTQRQYDYALAEGKIKDDELYLTPEEVIQPDFNQNDSSESDYIKNRPFYTTNEYEDNLVIGAPLTIDDSKIIKINDDVELYRASDFIPENLDFSYYRIKCLNLSTYKTESLSDVVKTNGDNCAIFSSESLSVIEGDTVPLVFIAMNNNCSYEGVVIPKKGIYFITLSSINYNVYEFTINNCRFVKEVDKLIDEKYIPMNAIKQAMLDFMYPIGHILMTTNGRNPSNYLGGSWSPWGSGRVPVGVDQSDEAIRDVDFASAELIGGEKSHILTAAELPNHDHDIPELKGMTFTEFDENGILTGDGVHNHYVAKYTESTLAKGTDFARWFDANRDLAHDGLTQTLDDGLHGDGGDHAHKIKTYASKTSIDEKRETAGHSNMQPYITCYMWKRVG